MEFEKLALSKQVSDLTRKLSKAEKALNHKVEYYKKELEDAFEVSKGLNQTCETLTKEKEELLVEIEELVDDQQNG